MGKSSTGAVSPRRGSTKATAQFDVPRSMPTRNSDIPTNRIHACPADTVHHANVQTPGALIDSHRPPLLLSRPYIQLQLPPAGPALLQTAQFEGPDFGHRGLQIHGNEFSSLAVRASSQSARLLRIPRLTPHLRPCLRHDLPAAPTRQKNETRWVRRPPAQTPAAAHRLAFLPPSRMAPRTALSPAVRTRGLPASAARRRHSTIARVPPRIRMPCPCRTHP